MKIISNKLYNEYTKTTINYHIDGVFRSAYEKGISVLKKLKDKENNSD